MPNQKLCLSILLMLSTHSVFSTSSIRGLLPSVFKASSLRFLNPVTRRLSSELLWRSATPAQQELLALQLARKEKALIRFATRNPVDSYLIFRKLEKNAKGEVLFRPFMPVFKQLLLHMASQKRNGAIDTPGHPLNQIYDDAMKLIAEGVPYRPTMRLIFRYLDSLNEPFLKKFPDLDSSFHRDNAKDVLEDLLSRAPDLFIFPTFCRVDVSFFLNTRSVPLHLIGIDLGGVSKKTEPPYADGFTMSPSEFAWHDVGHSEFISDRDFLFLEETFKPIERVVLEWDFTRKRISEFLNSHRDNPILHAAIELILFEILHERGYPYSLIILGTQLDTPKWTEILQRKYENNYFSHFPEIDLRLFSKLESARSALLEFIQKSRIKDQTNHLVALHAAHIPVRITHVPKVNYGRGYLESIILDGSPGAKVSLKNEEKSTRLLASDLILAQVSPTKETPFNLETCCRIEETLERKRKGDPSIEHVHITPEKEVFVVHTDGSKTPIEVFLPKCKDYHHKGRRKYFEWEQILGAHERCEIISYTHQEPSKIYLSKATLHDNGEQIILPNGITFPISEVNIDPLQK